LLRLFRVKPFVGNGASFYGAYSVRNWVALRFLLLKSFNSYQKAEYGYGFFCSDEFYLIKRGERKREEKKNLLFFIIFIFFGTCGLRTDIFVCCVPIVQFFGIFRLLLASFLLPFSLLYSY